MGSLKFKCSTLCTNLKQHAETLHFSIQTESSAESRHLRLQRLQGGGLTPGMQSGQMMYPLNQHVHPPPHSPRCMCHSLRLFYQFYLTEFCISKTQKIWFRPKISTDRAANLMLTSTGAYYLKEELFTVSYQLHSQGIL